MENLKLPNQKKLEVDPKTLSHLKSLVKKIDDLCFDNNIPYFFCAAVKDDGEKTEYFSSVKSAIPMNVSLAQNYFENYLKVLRGCEVVFPEHLPSVELLDAADIAEVLSELD